MSYTHYMSMYVRQIRQALFLITTWSSRKHRTQNGHLRLTWFEFWLKLCFRMNWCSHLMFRSQQAICPWETDIAYCYCHRQCWHRYFTTGDL